MLKRLIPIILALFASSASAQIINPGVIVFDEASQLGRARSLAFVGSTVSCGISGGLATCTFTAPSVGITVDSTTITGGTSGRVPYNNAGTYGESLMTLTSAGSPDVPTGQAYNYNGFAALRGQTALGNWFFGRAGNLTATGANNVVAGDLTAGSLSSGASNVIIGDQATYYLSSSSFNVVIGRWAGYNMTTSSNNNVLIGYNVASSVGSGAVGNTFLGTSAGAGVTNGDANTVVGAASIGNVSNNVVLADGDGVKRFWASSVALAEAATTVVTVPVASGAGTGGKIEYTVFASDATDRQTRVGAVRFGMINKAGTETCAIRGVNDAATVDPTETADGSGAGEISAGTLTYAWSVDTASANTCLLKLTPSSSLTQTTFRIDLTVNLNAAGIISIP